MVLTNETVNDGLLVGQIVAFLLFLASEVIGRSKCKYNGVIDMVMGGCGSCTVNLKNTLSPITSEIEPGHHEPEIVPLRQVVVQP